MDGATPMADALNGATSASPDATQPEAQQPARSPATTGDLSRAAALERILALVVAVGALSLLIVAGTLKPSPTGFGTHLQTGMPACGWLVATGYPCPTCGMTTAFAHASRGELASAFRVQPFGALAAIGVAVAFWVCLTVVFAGSRSGAACGKLLCGRILWIVAGAWAISWAYTIATWPRG